MGRVNFLISAHIYVSVDNCAEIYSVNNALQNQATLFLLIQNILKIFFQKTIGLKGMLILWKK